MRGQDRAQPDRAASEDRDRVAGADVAVERAEECGRQYVGQEDRGVVVDSFRKRIAGVVGQRDADCLGLLAAQLAELAGRVLAVAENRGAALGALRGLAAPADRNIAAGDQARDDDALRPS